MASKVPRGPPCLTNTGVFNLQQDTFVRSVPGLELLNAHESVTNHHKTRHIHRRLYKSISVNHYLDAYFMANKRHNSDIGLTRRPIKACDREVPRRLDFPGLGHGYEDLSWICIWICIFIYEYVKYMYMDLSWICLKIGYLYLSQCISIYLGIHWLTILFYLVKVIFNFGCESCLFVSVLCLQRACATYM